MDDEETIQVVAGEMLRYLGYEVLAAKDGEEAIAIYSDNYQSEQRIDIVIMDLTILGGMGGKEAVKRILQIDRDAKVIVSSGYSDDPLVQNYREAGFISVISKPYQLTDLSEILARTMDS
jgi:CheY-like chemotaxis protein